MTLWEHKAYLLGKRYEAEKKKRGGPEKSAHNEPVSGEPIRTADRLAEELGIGHATVKRAGDFAKAVDALVADQARRCAGFRGFCLQRGDGSTGLLEAPEAYLFDAMTRCVVATSSSVVVSDHHPLSA